MRMNMEYDTKCNITWAHCSCFTASDTIFIRLTILIYRMFVRFVGHTNDIT